LQLIQQWKRELPNRVMNMTLEFGILDGLFLVFARYARSYFFVRSIRLEEEGG